MKILIIDSHKGGDNEQPQNLHWLNADRLRNYFISQGHPTDLIWSYPSVNDNIRTGYDVIIFSHASRYSYVSTEWLSKNKQARLFYITNEYNLGEPVMLWRWVKDNDIKYNVIANHEGAASKVVLKYVDNWNILNLNALIIEPLKVAPTNSFFEFERTGCIYYGSFRKDRVKYFQKYLTGKVVISTHIKNRKKFVDSGITGPFGDRIDWNSVGLTNYKTLLYIEDESTHTNYNYLANRFYEGLIYNTFPIFDAACKNTLELSGYDIPDFAVVDSPEELLYITEHLPDNHTDILHQWREQAFIEKQTILKNILQLVSQ
jgi:hypothetical protein